MKRLLSVGLSLLLVFSVAGCNQTQPSTSDKKVLRVGMECNYAPFNWTQLDQSETAVLIAGGAAGYCDGYDVAIAKSIASDMGYELEIKKIEWDGLPIAVQNDEIDLIIAGMTDNEQRRVSLDFSTPYYSSEMVLVVRKDSTYANATSIQDFSGAKVVAQLNTFHDGIIDQINGVKHETPMKNFPIMTVAVQSKTVDAMVAELPSAKSIVNSNPDLKYIEFTQGNGFDAGADATVSIATKKGNTELLTKVQASLDKITEADRLAMMEAALVRQPAQ